MKYFYLLVILCLFACHLQTRAQIDSIYQRINLELNNHQVNNAEFDYYPYMDTMCFCYVDIDELRNTQDDERDDMRVCRSTDGDYYNDY
jgi:hypothetical protein